MKKIFKKQIALLLAILMVIVTIGGYLPHEADAVNAADGTTTYPAYMAKLVGTYGDYTYTWVHQEITPTAGVEYVFTCDYYVAEGTYSTATVWSTTVAYNAGPSEKMNSDDIGTMELSYTAVAGDNKVYVRFEAQPNTVCYVWNVCLCEKGSDVNLLQNADFSEEGGSWVGWRVKDNTTIKDKATSDAKVATYGQEIVPFSSNIIPIPEGIPTGAPEYMAKIEVPSDSGWAWVYQGIKPEVGKNYRFICNYYVEQGSGTAAVMWTNQSDPVKKSSLQSATQGSVELDYEAVSGDTNLMVRFECAPGTICYVWNVCLFEVDGDTNLLNNGSFSKENGSTTGWTITNGDMSVIPFDKSLIPAPSYMAKLKGTHIDAEGIMQTYVDVIQSIVPEEGITYTFTADYYDSAATGGASLLIWSNTSPHGEYRSKTIAATEGTLELSYTATESDSFLSVGMECDPEAECYLWNLSLTAKGSNQNLLENADFQKGLGSWVGWSIGECTSITEKSGSDVAVAAYGHEIVEFDREFIDSMKAEDALQKTYEDPNTSFQLEDVNQYKNLDLDTPTYMAKLNGTHVNADGATNKYTWVYQGITPTQGTTYHFSFEYYVADTNQGDSSTVAFIQTATGEVQKVSLSKGTRGVMDLTHTVGDGETWMNVVFYANPNSTCYIRNVKVHTNEKPDVNLLKNGNFAQNGGSWIDWQVGKNVIIRDKTTSDDRTENFGQEILVCDWNLFNEELADWSVKPQIDKTLDFTYQTELTVSQIENSTPEMHFEMYDGDEVIKTEQVQGELGTDGMYRFHLEVLPQQLKYQILGTLAVQTADGELRQTKQYSVKDYCVSILKDNSCSEELKNLVADLVRYGGATQAKLGFLDTITDEMSSIITDLGNQDPLADITDAVDTPIQGEQTEAECQWKSASLVLDDKVTIRLKFTTNDVTNLSVHVNDTVYTADGDNKIYLANDDIYYVDLPISASDYGDLINAKFYLDGEEHGAELLYSVHTYLYRKQDSATSKELLQAIYSYGQSASAYSEYLSKNGVESIEQTENDSYLFSSEGNASSRMNPQTGGADAQAKTMRETIMNADDTVSATSRTYYISSLRGNDANAGTTPETAWKTLDAYNQNKGALRAGDTVLFERGGIYRGEISATNKSILSLVSGVTYGAYGTGAKPAIYGSRQNYIGLESWSKTDTENIWVCNEEMTADVGTIVFNHGQAVGVKRLSVSEDLITNLTELKDNFEFYHDLKTGKLYLYMDSNPALTFYDIEICENSYMLFATARSQNITIDNLSLKYSGGHAIRFNPNATNITITNCEIGFIGGSLQTEGKDTRYGNGIEFWNACSGITVQNNWIYQIYDAGFTHQGGTVSGGYEQKDITFSNNLVEYCSYGIEFWAGNPDQDVMSNITYTNNMIRFSGYGWGVVRPNAFGVGAINTWGDEGSFTVENFSIENNVFDLSTRALILSYYDTNPSVTYRENTYYLKEGYAVLWEGRKYLAATSQNTMIDSISIVDKSPALVKFIEE